jgi:hypothetical protein
MRLSHASAILRGKGNPHAVGRADEIERGRQRCSGAEDERTLKDLAAGETGFTLPWAMSRTVNDDYYLNENYPLHPEPFGTVEMMVKRTMQGYVVSPPPGEEYEKEEFNHSAWFSIPVLRVEGADL